MKDKDAYMKAYDVDRQHLAYATKIMTFNGDFFESKVVDIIRTSWEETFIIVVRMNGSYPYITNQWKGIIKQ